MRSPWTAHSRSWWVTAALLCHGMPSEQQQVLYSGPITHVRLGLAAAHYAACVEAWHLGFWLALRDINMPSATTETTPGQLLPTVVLLLSLSTTARRRMQGPACKDFSCCCWAAVALRKNTCIAAAAAAAVATSIVSAVSAGYRLPFQCVTKRIYIWPRVEACH